MRKSYLSICLLSLVSIAASTALAQAQQHPGHINDMVRQIDERAHSISSSKLPEFNFEPPKFPNPFEKLKKLQLPKLGLMDKLKGMGSQSAQTKPSRPILDGLSKVFSPSTQPTPSLWQRLTGQNKGVFPETNRLEALNELNGIAQGIGQRTGQAAQSAQDQINKFSNSIIPGPQPPLRSAREGYGSSSRY